LRSLGHFFRLEGFSLSQENRKKLFCKEKFFIEDINLGTQEKPLEMMSQKFSQKTFVEIKKKFSSLENFG